MRIKGFDLSVGYFGLQIAFGIQSASLSRVFQGLGASVDQLAILWLAGPVTGLLVQPEHPGMLVVVGCYAGGFVEDAKHGWGTYTWGARTLFAGDRDEGRPEL